jgi:hypothetical protein
MKNVYEPEAIQFSGFSAEHSEFLAARSRAESESSSSSEFPLHGAASEAGSDRAEKHHFECQEWIL